MSAPYVLLHGFTGGPESWDAVRVPGGPVHRPRLPGHGPDPTPVLDWASTLERLLDDLESEGAVRGAHLVGYSLGGRLAQGLAALAASRPGVGFASLTVIGAHPGLRGPVARTSRRAADRRWVRLLREEGLAAFVDAWEALPLWASQAALPASVRARQRTTRLDHHADSLAEVIERLGSAEMPDYAPFWAAPPLPARRVVGAADANYRVLFGAAATVVEGAGHNVVLEAPAALSALLSAPPAGSP